MIELVKNTIDEKDIDNLIEWLKTYPRLTKGPVTKQVEQKWSNWIGRRHTIFCNSGSSANLLMFQALLEAGLVKTGDKVVVPALAWATDLAPVMQLGFNPIICDINLSDLSVDLNNLVEIFKKERPQILILVSVLGLVPEMSIIKNLCKKYNVILLEDTCESMGSKFLGKKTGTFGLMSSFSTYFGHHISTIEGGFVSTDDDNLRDILISIRSHGWDRDLEKEKQERLRKEWDISEFNSLYTFYYSGFNLRSTDLQAYLGLRQIDKLDNTIKIRNRNFNLYNQYIENPYWKVSDKSHCFVSNFAYPILHPNRDKMVKSLINSKVEVRPLICGSMSTQPFYIKKYGAGVQLKNSSIVDKYGFYIPNHPLLTPEEIEFISKKIVEHC